MSNKKTSRHINHDLTHQKTLATSDKVQNAQNNDATNICLLMFLYILQGIPLGLAAAIPYLLQSERNTVSYQAQATFSLVTWPFSFKLAWAPIVDSIYSSRIGRRKTWLIPVQYAIGVDLLILAGHVNEWLGRDLTNPWGKLGQVHPVDITQLTVAFFGLTFLAATQDIVVDGWALTMLSKNNIGWASTCNTVGQTTGYVIAFILLLCLESPEISNTYLRQTPVEGKGLITFSGFLYFWGVVFLVTTTLVGLLKREEITKSESIVSLQKSGCEQTTSTNNFITTNSKSMHDQISSFHKSENQLHSDGLIDFEEDYSNLSEKPSLHSKVSNHELSLADTYRVMLGIIRLKPVLQYILMLFIVKAGFAASDTITGLKLIEKGFPKEHLAILGVVLLPLQAILPLLITRWTNGPKPLTIYTSAILPRIFISSLVIPLVYYTQYFRLTDPASDATNISGDTIISHSFSWWFYIILLLKLTIYSLLSDLMFVTQMAFHARISDPAVGGTYMTLLNTAANLATSLPSTVFLSLVEPLTLRTCSGADIHKAGVTLLRLSSNYNTTSITEMFSSEQILEKGQIWLINNATCKPSQGIKACENVGGSCITITDGFYIEIGLCLLFSLICFPLFVRPLALRLDKLSNSAYYFQLTKQTDKRKIRKD